MQGLRLVWKDKTANLIDERLMLQKTMGI